MNFSHCPFLLLLYPPGSGARMLVPPTHNNISYVSPHIISIHHCSFHCLPGQTGVNTPPAALSLSLAPCSCDCPRLHWSPRWGALVATTVTAAASAGTGPASRVPLMGNATPQPGGPAQEVGVGALHTQLTIIFTSTSRQLGYLHVGFRCV
jgi:hypothetical protein